jgi:hypothetical protein
LPPTAPGPPVAVAGTLTTDSTTTTATIACGLRDDGDGAAVDPPGPDNSAETRYYLKTADGPRRYALSSARATPPGNGGDIDLEPGMTLWHADALIAAPGAEPAADLTRVCVEVGRPERSPNLVTVEITADACVPAAGLPAYCRVDERSETNNVITVTVSAP